MYNVPGEFGLEIPEECESVGICVDIPNYPNEQAKQIVEKLKASGVITDDTTELDDTRRVGPAEENVELCKSEQRTLTPKAGVDEEGHWHVVLNPDDNPTQQFAVEMCSVENSSCAKFVVFQPGYEGVCIQSYMYYPMRIIHTDGTKSKKNLKLPTTCSCVVRRKES
ncbi:hypothetical protein PYW08_001792 [Mythimna loreyi]|uniref:Uncharacterized protein n=1 Tax=Mythimna loreyi TaxID=667449 RepID=A0ACC2R7J4_9NEOP|nr:hypothetical protein PYW08_001792 [Mythimna loreyi]